VLSAGLPSMTEATEADYGPLEFPSNVEVNDNVPSEEKIAKVADFPVLDVDGKNVPFRSLYEGANGEKKDHKVLVIFVRHFYCGVSSPLNSPRVTSSKDHAKKKLTNVPSQNCQDFLEYLSKGLPSPAELEALPTPVSIAIVGCGASSLIPYYVEKTSCPFPVYADPTRRVFSVLEMTRSTARSAQLPEYVRGKSLFRGAINGIGQIFSRIPKGDGLKGGAFDQVGGDFLFENGKVTWCHRMRDTTDHSDLPKIREVLGLPLASVVNDTTAAKTEL
jgi:hypothetical protein